MTDQLTPIKIVSLIAWGQPGVWRKGRGAHHQCIQLGKRVFDVEDRLVKRQDFGGQIQGKACLIYVIGCCFRFYLARSSTPREKNITIDAQRDAPPTQGHDNFLLHVLERAVGVCYNVTGHRRAFLEPCDFPLSIVREAG